MGGGEITLCLKVTGEVQCHVRRLVVVACEVIHFYWHGSMLVLALTLPVITPRTVLIS